MTITGHLGCFQLNAIIIKSIITKSLYIFMLGNFLSINFQNLRIKCMNMWRVLLPNPNCPPEKFVSIYKFYQLLHIFANTEHFSLSLQLLLNTCEREYRPMHFGGIPWGIPRVTGVDCENEHVGLFKWTCVTSFEKKELIHQIMWWHSITHQYCKDLDITYWECCLPNQGTSPVSTGTKPYLSLQSARA